MAFFFLTYYVLLNLEMVIIPNGDYRKFKPIKIVLMWDIIKSVLLDQLLYFMILTLSVIFVVFFPLSLKIQPCKNVMNKNWREETQLFGT